MYLVTKISRIGTRQLGSPSLQAPHLPDHSFPLIVSQIIQKLLGRAATIRSLVELDFPILLSHTWQRARSASSAGPYSVRTIPQLRPVVKSDHRGCRKTPGMADHPARTPHFRGRNGPEIETLWPESQVLPHVSPPDGADCDLFNTVLETGLASRRGRYLEIDSCCVPLERLER